MKTYKTNKLLGLALVGGFSLFSATNALASAGTSITNSATLSYSVGGTGQPDEVASATFVEDRIINFSVARQGVAAVEVGPDATDQAVGFTLTNIGNSTQDFLLRAENSTAIDPFPPNGANAFDPLGGTFEAFVDDGNGTPDIGGADSARTVVNLASGASITVWLVSDMPGSGGLTNGDITTVQLVVRAAKATAASGFVTPEEAGGETAGAGAAADAFKQDHNGNFDLAGDFQILLGGTDTVVLGDGSSDKADEVLVVETVFFTGSAEESDISSYAMQIATLTITKTSVVLYDDLNGSTNPKAIPGAYVTYTITITNAAGAGDADLTTITDALDAATDLDPDYVTNAGPGNPTNAGGDAFELIHSATPGSPDYCTGDVVGADGCSYSGGAGGNISVNIATVAADATLAASESMTLKYNVIVQ